MEEEPGINWAFPGPGWRGPCSPQMGQDRDKQSGDRDWQGRGGLLAWLTSTTSMHSSPPPHTHTHDPFSQEVTLTTSGRQREP